VANMSNMEMNTPPSAADNGKKTAWLLSYGLLFSGLCLMFLSILGTKQFGWPDPVTAFIRDCGLLLAAVIAGSILHEKLLRDEMLRQLREELDGAADSTARSVHRLFCEYPPGMTGIKLLDAQRRNYAGYYSWVNEQKQQYLFFAGRSVLHRIDADIRERMGHPASAEKILLRRLKEGSKISILFLDPRIDIISRLAVEEGQTPAALLGDLATSIGICHRLFELLESATLPASAELTIRVYDRVPYFAYHRQDTEAIVGFYFLSMKGYSSAAYELVDDVTKRVFDGHFGLILAEAARGTLVEYDGARGRATFNDQLFGELRTSLKQQLGPAADDLLGGHHSSKTAAAGGTAP